jgi:hypothetical protein
MQSGLVAGLVLLFAVYLPSGCLADGTDSVTGLPRAPIHIVAWPAGKKVAVSFALFVEEFGFGLGPVFRPDLASRSPDLVNEAFRQYAIDWGIPRVGRIFKELDVPLTVVLNAEFPDTHASVWKEFRAAQPNAPIIAHGINNTGHMLPLGDGIAGQRAYVIDGRFDVTLFGSHGRYRLETLDKGDVAYIPQGYGPSIENIGARPGRLLIGLNTGAYQAIDLTQWIAGVPPYLLADHFGQPKEVFETFPKQRAFIAPPDGTGQREIK